MWSVRGNLYKRERTGDEERHEIPRHFTGSVGRQGRAGRSGVSKEDLSQEKKVKVMCSVFDADELIACNCDAFLHY